MTTRLRALLAALSLAFLAGCLPNLNTLHAPSFRYVPEGSGLVKLEPPGVGEAAAVFRFNLEVENPNAFRLYLVGLEAIVFVNERAVAEGRLPARPDMPGLEVSGEGRALLPLEVRVPLRRGVAVLGDLAGLLAGQPLRVRLEGAPVLAFGQIEQALPRAPIFAATLEQPLGGESATRPSGSSTGLSTLTLTKPTFRLDPDGSGLRELSVAGARYDVALVLENPTPLGYIFSVPGLELRFGGAEVGTVVGTVSVDAVAVPAFGEARLVLPFSLTPTAVAALAGGAPSLTLSGEVRLALPGITETVFAPGVLLSGGLR